MIVGNDMNAQYVYLSLGKTSMFIMYYLSTKIACSCCTVYYECTYRLLSCPLTPGVALRP